MSGPGLASVAPAAIRVAGCDSMPCHVGHDVVTPNHGHHFDYEADFDARKLFWGVFSLNYLNILHYCHRFWFSDTDTKSFRNLFRRNTWT